MFILFFPLFSFENFQEVATFKGEGQKLFVMGGGGGGEAPLSSSSVQVTQNRL